MKSGKHYMGKKYFKILVVVFFPITSIFLIVRWIFRIVQRKMLDRYFVSLDINKIDTLDGFEFEELLYLLFKSVGVKVEKTKSSHDYGADLVVTTKNQKIVIQSKLYYKHSVGNSAVQEIATAKDYYSANLGMVITNSYFTKPACNLANSVGVKLCDRNTLAEFLKLDRYNKKLFLNNLNIE